MLYDEYVKNNGNFTSIDEIGVCPSKKVVQYDLQGNYINEFKSTKDALLFLGSEFSAEGIRSCCRGVRKSHKSFIFKYGS